ncbi:MAG TPA: protein translocase subunit SecF, partial [Actinomycetota bacterium]|nr:protein translocase subunit SecF [Actinomycetota bacterium]
LNFGIDFKGGAVFRVQAVEPVTEAKVRDAVGPVAEVVQITENEPVQVSVQTEVLEPAEVTRIRTELAGVAGTEVSDVSTETIGSKWGSTVSRKAIVALLVFLVVVTLYVSLRMEFKMAVAALVALLHDLIITAGIFALARFEVTPATVIALLTILGYSLYDTVVVFDKVRENTGALTSMSRTTYSQATNLAVNQTMMRSLNTSLASLLPILGLLLVGNYLLGAETLKDLALALFVGVAAGAYSSIFIAPPIVAMWKEKEPRYAQLRARVERLGAQGATERPERPERPARPVRAGGAARDARSRRAAAPPPEPELAPDPELPPDEELEEVAGAEPAEPAVVAQTPARRQPQKPRPTQQRRKPSGRQQSRPAKRRRR